MGLSIKLVTEQSEALTTVIPWMSALRQKQEWISIDIETTGLNFRSPSESIRTLQLSDRSTAFVLPFDLAKSTGVYDMIDKMGFDCVAHNAKFEMSWLPELRHLKWLDTYIMSQLVTPQLKKHTLEDVGTRWVTTNAFDAKDAKDKLFTDEGYDWDTVPIDHPTFVTYAGTDALLCANVFVKLSDVVDKKGMRPALDLEHEVLPIVIAMEHKGFAVDLDMCRERLAFHEAEVAVHKQRLLDLGAPTNKVGQLSMHPPNLGQWLWDLTHHSELIRASGSYNTAEEVLEKIDHDAARTILGVRKNQKVGSTYYKRWIEGAIDGRLHPTFRQSGTETGRFSSSAPNLQQVPRGQGPRDALVASEGGKIVQRDLSQVEPRLLARISGDQELQALMSKGDIYLGLHPDRNIAKMFWLASAYGASKYKLARASNQTSDRVEQILSEFPEAKQLKEWTAVNAEACRMRASKAGDTFVVTQLGRRVYFDEGRIGTKMVNSFIQGNAAEYMKGVMVRMEKAGLAKHLVAVVHDETLSDVPAGDVVEYDRELEKCFNNTESLPHIVSDGSVGDSYAEAK